MHNGGVGPLLHLFAHDGSRVFIRIACMNNQRQSGFPGCRDMRAKAALLAVAWAAVIEIVQPGFANPHNTGVLGQFD